MFLLRGGLHCKCQIQFQHSKELENLVTKCRCVWDAPHSGLCHYFMEKVVTLIFFAHLQNSSNGAAYLFDSLEEDVNTVGSCSDVLKLFGRLLECFSPTTSSQMRFWHSFFFFKHKLNVFLSHVHLGRRLLLPYFLAYKTHLPKNTQ